MRNNTMRMKIVFGKPLISCLVLLPCAAASGQETLFSDNFDVTSPSYTATPPGDFGDGPNHDAANPGRQDGTLATPTLAYGFNGNVQVGNTATLTPAPGSSLGDELLLAAFTPTGEGDALLNYNFATIAGPITVSFDGLPNYNSGNDTDWISFSVGELADTRVPFPTDPGLDFSILFRQNGGTQYFEDGVATTGATGTALALNTWSSYKLVLSDTAGTGSAFAGAGSKIEYYQNGTLLGTASLGSQLTGSQGYFGFDAGSIGGVDNLLITSPVPEPSSVMMGLSGLTGLLFLRRRRK